MTERDPLRLFEGVGIEIEYMIVDADSLAVRPLADELLREVGGGWEQEVERGAAGWSNELALHLVEIKTNGPARDLGGLGAMFAGEVAAVEEILDARGARLMPTAMHPWMDSHTELRLWSRGDDAIYRALDAIFDCRGHGWANLQSVHVNLPFANDDELGRLHAAIRIALPILPALAASSPYADGRAAPALDYRMEAYRTNAARIPSVTGVVIPEAVFTRAAYEGEILERIYRDMEREDPEGVLRHEWINARGCIARFDRMALEIRVLDVQEHPGADIAVAGAVVAAVRALVEEHHAGQRELRRWHEGALAEILGACVTGADHAVLRDKDYLSLFGFPDRPPCRARDLWQHLVETVVSRDPLYPEWREPLETILSKGCLARRIRAAVGDEPIPDRDRLRDTYRRLCDCLRDGSMFEPRPRLTLDM